MILLSYARSLMRMRCSGFSFFALVAMAMCWVRSERLLADLGDGTGADGLAALADGEALLLFHGDRGDELDLHGDRVTGHDHLRALGEEDLAGHIGRAEVELRLVPFEERGGAGRPLPWRGGGSRLRGGC